MSRDTEFRLFFNNEPASQEDLDLVETITVDQETGMAWEARVEMPVCLDAQGRWQGPDERLLRNTSRVRVEISVRGGPFVALIDGPVVSLDKPMHARPGQSSITLVVRDDSDFLNREDLNLQSEAENVRDLVEEIYSDFEQIEDTDLDRNLGSIGIDVEDFRQNGSAMQILRNLAECLRRFAYVLPGEQAGESIGCFKTFPHGTRRSSATDELPEMVLLGREANINDLTINKDLGRPARYQGSRLNMTDKEIDSQSASFRDHEDEALGEEAALSSDESPAGRRIGTGPCGAFGLDEISSASARESGFAFTATGNVREGCYRGVLRPYRMVTVIAGETPDSGEYGITQVTHTLTRSNYTQSFRLTRNAQTEDTGDRTASAAQGVF
jgi:hypothetical protein